MKSPSKIGGGSRQNNHATSSGIGGGVSKIGRPNSVAVRQQSQTSRQHKTIDPDDNPYQTRFQNT